MKTNHMLGKKNSLQIMHLIKNLYPEYRTQSWVRHFFKNEQKIWTEASPQNTHEWQINTWKSAQHHRALEKYKLKLLKGHHYTSCRMTSKKNNPKLTWSVVRVRGNWVTLTYRWSEKTALPRYLPKRNVNLHIQKKPVCKCLQLYS